MSDRLLRHEQLHFDISELFARKLAIAFRSAVYTKDYKNELSNIFNKIMEEVSAMQTKYDSESQHGLNANMQNRWEIFIFLELKNLPKNY